LPDTWVSLDDVLQPAVADARSVSPKKKVVRKHAAAPQPTSDAPESQQTPATPVAPTPASTEPTELAMAETTQPVQADATMLNRYAERQSQSQDQQKFAGGDAIVIGAGTLVVVLLVVLLLVLLL
jgi:cobalamin biosynthesis Mg chelatase CobN